MRSLQSLLLLGLIARGQTLEQAVGEIAKSISAQLSAGEVAHVSERSLAPEFASETARAKTLLDRALRRPAARDARTVEVAVTATENVRGPLLVVQSGASVETASYVSAPAVRSSRPSLVISPLWRQDDPILDVAALSGDQMLVLSPGEIRLLRSTNGRWEPAGSAALSALPPSRDPRGRLVVSGDAMTAFLSGGTCRGNWNPSLDLNCELASGEFQVDGQQFHFSPGQNTLETADGQKAYSAARAGDYRLTASTDGKTHLARGEQASSLSGWGSDLASIGNCNGNTLVIASSAAPAGTADSVAAYEITAPHPSPLSEPTPLQGSVSALWAQSNGVLAVVHEASRYAAYLLSLDCGH